MSAIGALSDGTLPDAMGLGAHEGRHDMPRMSQSMERHLWSIVGLQAALKVSEKDDTTEFTG